MNQLRTIAIIFIVLAVVGITDAGYLTIKHYTNTIPPCTLQGCETVVTSQYSEISGVPVALFGVLYYLGVLILSFLYLMIKREEIIKMIAVLTLVGLVSSAYFVYLQLYVIKAICQYCMLSAGISAILFVVGMYVLSKTRKSKRLV